MREGRVIYDGPVKVSLPAVWNSKNAPNVDTHISKC